MDGSGDRCMTTHQTRRVTVSDRRSSASRYGLPRTQPDNYCCGECSCMHELNSTRDRFKIHSVHWLWYDYRTCKFHEMTRTVTRPRNEVGEFPVSRISDAILSTAIGRLATCVQAKLSDQKSQLSPYRTLS